ncbi:hypothetical protein HMI55_005605 [Coelomomyces lativittatus]|nr:hypothetical protein HMI55_005605 [Coelomomyces lativittatus]
MLLAKRQREKEIQSTIHHSQDLWTDGPLEKPKEAHDNDFSDFKKIRIIPTMQEILYPHLPTLPGNQQSIPYAHWLEPGPLRLLDTHFRLLRQDMFASIQSGLKSLISNLHTIQSTRRYKKSCGYEQVDLMVYTHLQPHKMDFDFDYGSCFSNRTLATLSEA